jgi:hypothetical protein
MGACAPRLQGRAKTKKTTEVEEGLRVERRGGRSTMVVQTLEAQIPIPGKVQGRLLGRLGLGGGLLRRSLLRGSGGLGLGSGGLLRGSRRLLGSWGLLGRRRRLLRSSGLGRGRLLGGGRGLLLGSGSLLGGDVLLASGGGGLLGLLSAPILQINKPWGRA